MIKVIIHKYVTKFIKSDKNHKFHKNMIKVIKYYNNYKYYTNQKKDDKKS